MAARGVVVRRKVFFCSHFWRARVQTAARMVSLLRARCTSRRRTPDRRSEGVCIHFPVCIRRAAVSGHISRHSETHTAHTKG